MEGRVALPPAVWADALNHAIQKSVEDNVSGQASTPYLLRAVADFTQGATVVANEKLLLANATLAAQVALKLIEKQAQT